MCFSQAISPGPRSLLYQNTIQIRENHHIYTNSSVEFVFVWYSWTTSNSWTCLLFQEETLSLQAERPRSPFSRTSGHSRTFSGDIYACFQSFHRNRISQWLLKSNMCICNTVPDESLMITVSTVSILVRNWWTQKRIPFHNGKANCQTEMNDGPGPLRPENCRQENWRPGSPLSTCAWVICHSWSSAKG